MDEEFSHIFFLLLFVWWQWRGNLTLAQCCLWIPVLGAQRMVMVITIQLETKDIINIHETILLHFILQYGRWLPMFWRNILPLSSGKK
jgi:hypothetical protein